MNSAVKSEIEKIKEKIIPVLNKHGIIHAGLFGSIVRGEITPDSDIDVLIEIPEHSNISLFDLAGIEMELEEILKRKVDLLTYNSIHHLLKDKILQEEIKIA